jgi:hypothetical protein
MVSEAVLGGSKVLATGKLMSTRLPGETFPVSVWPVLALSWILRTPSAGEFALKFQFAEPPTRTDPQVTSTVAALLPEGKANTPVGNVTAMLADDRPLDSALLLTGKLMITPPSP